MIVEVDQSGKVEDTAVATVVGAANKDFCYTVILSAAEKRKLQKFFRIAGKSKTFSYRIFAALIFLALTSNMPVTFSIVIDEEYTGHDQLIKLFLLRLIRANKPKLALVDISFAQIGKKSPAHDAAYFTYKGIRPADLRVSAKDILQLYL